MNERTIRRPTGPVVIFIIMGLSSFYTLLSSLLITQFMDNSEPLQIPGILRMILSGVSALFMGIVLSRRKYNNTLIVGASVLLIPSVYTLFINISPYNISEIIFYLVLIAFAYIMVKMPETPIREKAVKFRFIIPLSQFIIILISTIQTMQSLYKNLTETMGSPLTDSMNVAIALFPSILGAIAGFLPVLCYVWLANWLADPYEE